LAKNSVTYFMDGPQGLKQNVHSPAEFY